VAESALHDAEQAAEAADTGKLMTTKNGWADMTNRPEKAGQEALEKAMAQLNQTIREEDRQRPVPFQAFLKLLSADPAGVVRNVFQVFHSMVRSSVGEGEVEYPDDPESINFVQYDCSRLFVENSDHPFFADRLFANRFIKHSEAMRHGAQQNKIYIFEGPPGCGKSTFLNNLLRKFEEYANTPEGQRYEIVWRLDRKLLRDRPDLGAVTVLEKICRLFENDTEGSAEEANRLSRELDRKLHKKKKKASADSSRNSRKPFLEIPCPSHDNPLLIIPKSFRRSFLDELFRNDRFKWEMFTDKAYEWVFRENPCTICSSLYDALLRLLGSPLRVFESLYARPYSFNRRLGEGISVFNPGDRPMRESVLTNARLQSSIDRILDDSNQVRYLFSRYAKTNNGIYALMDIKSHNTERLIELHNIVSEGVHKVEDIEENVNSLFIALMNPEDKKNIQNIQSFSDRIEYITIPYVLDLNTEVEIYRNIFGKHIDNSFLPRVLHNFARVIISSRLNIESPAMQEWIPDPDKYSRYCDRNLQLLKMEIYAGYIPKWLQEEDLKRYTARLRKRILNESETEGDQGFSGRDAIRIFNEFYSTYRREDKPITMAMLASFFSRSRKDLTEYLPPEFMESLTGMYDFTVLQEVKECIYYYNKEQIARDIKNYLFAINFESDGEVTVRFTGDRIEVSEDYLSGIEARLLGATADDAARRAFRQETLREYTSRTLTQEMIIEEKDLEDTALYQELNERYLFQVKEKVLDPFIQNENFPQGDPGFRYGCLQGL
jgi:predicted Ser/Thr protein kinase